MHDFDILRWLTGREIVEVYAKGSNNGDPAIGEVVDVDTALALVTFDDGTVEASQPPGTTEPDTTSASKSRVHAVR